MSSCWAITSITALQIIILCICCQLFTYTVPYCFSVLQNSLCSWHSLFSFFNSPKIMHLIPVIILLLKLQIFSCFSGLPLFAYFSETGILSLLTSFALLHSLLKMSYFLTFLKKDYSALIFIHKTKLLLFVLIMAWIHWKFLLTNSIFIHGASLQLQSILSCKGCFWKKGDSRNSRGGPEVCRRDGDLVNTVYLLWSKFLIGSRLWKVFYVTYCNITFC